ncbi:MAG: beta strand repeat-containing protein, partial [Planctomyces sp.]
SIIINTALDAGGGVVSLVTTGAVTITAPITAEEITISAGSLTQPLVTDTDRLTLSLGTAGQNIVVQEADQLVLGSSTINGGSLTLTAGGAVTVDGTISNISSLNLNSSGSIRGMVGAELEVSGAAHLTGSSITLGTQPGETINFGSLQVTSTGAVSITEDSSISLRGANTAGSLTLRTTTTVADAGSSIAVTGDLQVEASSITLADSGQESLNVSGNALFTTSTGGNIVVAAAGNAQFGSVTFQTDNSVSIAEDGDMQLSGSSSAQSVTLNSSGAITDSGATLIVTGDVQLTGNGIALTNTVNEQINVSGNVSFTSTGADITVGATGTTNFGSMTFTTTGSVSIAEDSSSDLVGNSTGGSLTIVSSGTITDTTGGAASIVLTGDASLTGANIVLGDNSGDNISVAGNAVLSATSGGTIDVEATGAVNFGTLTFVSDSTVNIIEDSSTEIVGTNSAGTLNLTSAGALIDPATIDVTGDATFTGTSIFLAGDPADVLNVGQNLLLIATGGGSIIVDTPGTVTLGSLTFQTTGAVTVAEDSDMLLSDTNTAGTLTLISTGQISNAAAASVTVTGNANLTGGSMLLGYAAGDALNFASLTLSSTGSVTLIEDSSTSLTNTSTVDTLMLTSATGGVSIDGTLNVITDGTILATGTNPDIQINGTAQTTSGILRLRAYRNVLFSASAQLLSSSGSLVAIADAAGTNTWAAGAITMTNGARLNAGSGTVQMTAPGDVTVSMVASTGTVSITSTQGGILDGGDTDIDLQGNAFALTALQGIGSANPLETSINTIAWLHTGSGEVRIAETDTLTVAAAGSLSSSSSSGTVRLNTGSQLTFASNATQGALFAATASTSATGEHIQINAGSTVRTTSGNAELTAGDSIRILGNGLLVANLSELILISGFGDSDNVGGMTLDGTLQALAAGQTVTLDLRDQQGAAQNATTGRIIAPNLRLLSSASSTAGFSLLAASRNDVDVLAANTSGAITYRDVDDLTIAAVAASSGVAALNGISTTNGVSEGTPISIIVGGTLTADRNIRTTPIGGAGSQTAGTVTLESLSASLILTDNGDIFADGPVSLTAATTIQTAGEVTTSNDDLTFRSPVSLTGAVFIDTGSGIGNITFDQTVNGGNDLTLTAGTGNITFSAAVGQISRPATLRIVSVADASFSATVSVTRFVQDAGTGTTTLSGTLNTSDSAGVSIAGNKMRVGSGITTSGGGTVTVVLSGTAPSGAAIIDNGATINSDGAVSLTAPGGLTTGGDITTSNDNITITAVVTLSGSITINSGSGAGDISFSSSIDGSAANAQSLTLNSGALGTITVPGPIGKSTSLRILTIADSNGTTLGTLDSDFIIAGTQVRVVNSQPGKRVRFNGGVQTPQFNADAGPYDLQFAGSGTNIGTDSGPDYESATMLNTGAVIFGDGNSDILMFRNGLRVTTASSIDLDGWIYTQRSPVSLGDSDTATNLKTHDSVIDTTAAGAFPIGDHITFGGVIEGKTAGGGENLAMDAGTTGDITLLGNAGNARRIGTLLIRNAVNVTLRDVTAQTLLQTTGTGTTTFNGTVNTTSATGVDVTTTNIIVNA